MFVKISCLIRTLLKSDIKKTLKDLIVFIRHKAYRGNIWANVYEKFSDVPFKGDAFQSDYWIRSTYLSTQYKYFLFEKGKYQPSKNNRLLVNLVEKYTSNQKITILDIGGAAGISYLELLHSFHYNHNNINYHIVDNNKLCELGKNIFKEYNNIHFHDHLPENTKLNNIDIVYLCSTIQYIEDYKSFFTEIFVKYKPTNILITYSEISTTPTFTTAQINVLNYNIPVKFFNIKELICLMKKNEYTLLVKKSNKNNYNMDHFSPQFQAKEFLDLQFTRDQRLISDNV